MVQSIKMMNGKGTTKDNVKMVLGLIFGIAADAAVTAALGSLIPAGGGWKRLMRMGGVFVLAMMTGEKVEEYVGKAFDDMDEALREAREELKEDKDISKEGSEG